MSELKQRKRVCGPNSAQTIARIPNLGDASAIFGEDIEPELAQIAGAVHRNVIQTLYEDHSRDFIVNRIWRWMVAAHRSGNPLAAVANNARQHVANYLYHFSGNGENRTDFDNRWHESLLGVPRIGLIDYVDFPDKLALRDSVGRIGLLIDYSSDLYREWLEYWSGVSHGWEYLVYGGHYDYWIQLPGLGCGCDCKVVATSDVRLSINNIKIWNPSFAEKLENWETDNEALGVLKAFLGLRFPSCAGFSIESVSFDFRQEQVSGTPSFSVDWVDPASSLLGLISSIMPYYESRNTVTLSIQGTARWQFGDIEDFHVRQVVLNDYYGRDLSDGAC